MSFINEEIALKVLSDLAALTTKLTANDYIYLIDNLKQFTQDVMADRIVYKNKLLTLVNDLQSSTNRVKEIDIQQWLRQEITKKDTEITSNEMKVLNKRNISVKSIFGMNSFDEIRNLLTEDLRHSYILFDSDKASNKYVPVDITYSPAPNYTVTSDLVEYTNTGNAITTTFNKLDADVMNAQLFFGTELKWSFVNYATYSPGTISTSERINSIVGIKVGQASLRLKTIPRLLFPIADFTAATNIRYTDLDSAIYDGDNQIDETTNFTIFIKEFSTQSTIDSDGNRYHFNMTSVLMNPIKYPDGNVRPQTRYYELLPTNDTYIFNPVFNYINSLTLVIKGPYEAIPICKIERLILPLEFIYKA